MAYSLLFGLPGAPMLFYGEEIGMSEQLALPGRMSVRSPMQWSSYDNGGFSHADPARLVRPIVTAGDYGFDEVSVGAQRSDGDSLLNWLAALIRVRRECSEIGVEQPSPLEFGNDAVLGLRYDAQDSAIVVLNNLSGKRQTVSLELTDDKARSATDLLGDRRYEPVARGDGRLQIAGYGYRWLRLGGIY